MKRREQLDADGFIELGKRPLVTFFRANVVTGGEGMFGVETNAQPFVLFRCIHHVADLLEAIAQVGTLAGGDFQRDLDLEAGAGLVNFVQRLGNCLDPFDFTGADMGAGVGDQVRHAENFAAFHFVDERGDGTHAQGRVGGAEIEQIGIVGDHRRDAGFFAVEMELGDFVLAQRF